MDFVGLLTAFLSPDNVRRKAAETQLNALKAHKDDLPLELLKVLRSSPEARLRLLSAVLLRRVLLEVVDEAEHTWCWETLKPESRAVIQEQLLAATEAEPENSNRRKVCDTLAQVALMVFALGDPWGELWGRMHAWVTSASYPLQAASLLLFEYLGEHIAETMQDSFPAFAGIFMARLTDAAAPLHVRASACTAAISVMVSMPPRSSALDHFTPLIPHFMTVFLASEAAKDDDRSITLISVLIDLIDVHAFSLKKYLRETVKLMADVAGNTGAHNEVRKLCLEFLTTLAEKVPGLVRKMPDGGFLKTVLPVALRMLMDHGLEEPTDAEWDATEGTDPYEEGEGCNIPVAEEALDRIGGVIGSETFLPQFVAMTRYFFSPEHTGPDSWKWRYAGLSALSEASELYEDSGSTFDAILELVGGCMGDASVRVRHALLGLLGNLCHYQAPMFQIKTHERIVPAMLAGLEDPSRRVRGQAALCVAAFAQQLLADTDEETLAPHLGTLFPALFKLIGGADTWCQQQGITAVSALAEASQGLVAPFYDIVVPGVKAILAQPDAAVDPALVMAVKAGTRDRRELHAATALSRHVRMMKGRALECLTVMGACVGPERFRDDAVGAMAGIAGMIAHAAEMKAAAQAAEATGGAAGAAYAASLLQEDDPVPRFMWEAVGRIAKTVGAEAFAPYLPVVLPPLLADLAKEAKVTVVRERHPDEADDGVGEEEDEEEEEEAGEDDEYTHLQKGRTVIKVRTAAIDDKNSAVNAVSNILEHCQGSALAPFVPALLAATVPLLQAGKSPVDDIRAGAAGAVVYIVASAVAAVTVAEAAAVYATARSNPASLAADPSVPASMLRVVYGVIDALLEAMKDEEQHEMLVAMTTATLHCLQEGTDTANFADGAAALAAGAPKCTPLLESGMLNKVTDALLEVRRDALQRRSIRAAELKVHADDYDDKAVEDIKVLENEDAQLTFYAIEAIGAMIKAHREDFLPVFAEKLAPVVVDVSHPACLGADKQLGVFLIDDVLEFIGEKAIDPTTGRNYADSFLPILVAATADKHDATRQGALYGLGAAAENLPISYAPHLASVVAALQRSLSAPVHASRTEVEDNAVTALGKLIIHQYDPATGQANAAAVAPAAFAGCPSRQDLVNSFLLGLPCTMDRDEARVAIQMLCSFLDLRDPCMLNGGDHDVPRLTHALRVFACTMRDRLTCTAPIRARMAASMAKLRAELPPAMLGQVWAGLPEKDREKITELAAAPAPAPAAGAGAAP